jgi:hypothetical protein
MTLQTISCHAAGGVDITQPGARFAGPIPLPFTSQQTDLL